MPVERNLYRIRILNACNSRLLKLTFITETSKTPLPFLLFKADSSYYNSPVNLTSVEIPVGARVELVFDFSVAKSGENILIRNIGQLDWAGNPEMGSLVLEEVMQFAVSKTKINKITLPLVLLNLNIDLIAFPYTYQGTLVNRYATLYELRD